MTVKILTRTCRNLDATMRMEWLETNGIGGYASSTIAGCNTRRYHGLLVARLTSPPGKYLLLSKYEETLLETDNETALTVNRYPGVLDPPNYSALTGFVSDKSPLFKFQTERVHLSRRTMLVQNQNTVINHYICTKNQSNAILRIRPLTAFRDFHNLTRENVDLQVRTFPAKNGFMFQPYEVMPALYFQTTGSFSFFSSPTWYRGIEYTCEQERGFDYSEDLFSPGFFEIQMAKDDEIFVTASDHEIEDIEALAANEMKSRSAFHKKLRGTTFQKTLKIAANQFFSTSENGTRSITAGYPWFLEWGRDAMISLPGLLLHDDRKNSEYIAVLKGFASQMHAGVIPNFLGAVPEQNAYNAGDASLWFGWAVQQYLYSTADYSSIKGPILKAIEEIYSHYRAGTLHGIHTLDNGLLSVGSKDIQVTWMDATVNGVPVTPRYGCPVEINALWYNFVAFVDELSHRNDVSFGKDASGLMTQIRKSFVDTFWLEEGYLADVLQGDTLDKSIRPNQIFAASLPYSCLTREMAAAVVATVKKHLVTPLGLRTLAPESRNYRATYHGSPETRDRAYHNGTVWPWLIGHYAEAALATTDAPAEVIASLTEIVESFKTHLQTDGLGSISEVFDGNRPERGNGCISQAWSVAEVLRLTRILENAKVTRKKASKKSKNQWSEKS